MVAFKTQLPRTRESANVYFNRVSLDIIGNPNPCGDGLCCPFFEDEARCPPDCGLGSGGRIECPGAVCTNPFDPTNYSVCSGSAAGLIASEDWALVPNGGCTGGKCEYECNSGYMPSVSGDTCVPVVCSGAAGFANATMCSGDNTGITVPTAWSVVPNGGCTSAKCEYECNPGYYQASSVDCVLAECVGSGFGGATICPGDGVGLTTSVLRTLVSACSFPDGTDPKCQYTCDAPGAVIYGGACCVPGCPIGSCGPGQNDGCGGTIDCPACCGNGSIDGAEECDSPGPNPSGFTCANRGFTGTGGPLMCYSPSSASPCTFDTINCCNAVNGTWGGPYTNDGSVCGQYSACQQRQIGVCSATCGGTCTSGSQYQYVACGTVVGGWSASATSACSVSCGGGTQTENRVCNNPSPACGGECQRWDGSYTTPSNRTDTRTISCNTQECPGPAVYQCPAVSGPCGAAAPCRTGGPNTCGDLQYGSTCYYTCGSCGSPTVSCPLVGHLYSSTPGTPVYLCPGLGCGAAPPCQSGSFGTCQGALGYSSTCTYSCGSCGSGTRSCAFQGYLGP